MFLVAGRTITGYPFKETGVQVRAIDSSLQRRGISMFRQAFTALLLVTASGSAAAQHSLPAPLAPAAPISASQDTPYPGTMQLRIDATDTQRGILQVRQRIPVAKPGQMTLLFPKWLPGHHSPSGPVDRLAGLRFSANGQTLRWQRDPVEVFAYHVDVPQGATLVEAEFQIVTPTASDQGGLLVTPEMLRIQFISASLYPAGYFTRQIPVEATVVYPEGWTSFSGLASHKVGPDTVYAKTDYETLADSPTLAGRHAKQWELAPGMFLDMVAEDPAELVASTPQVEAHKSLAVQALKLFGSRHFKEYHLLTSISSRMIRIGLEHQASSENGVVPGYFTKWDTTPQVRNLLPHELTHSWNGKYRRGADLWTPDFHTPMRDSLLWVYEGQTQFWGYVLQARSGLVSKADTLDQLAMIAATLDTAPARQWRPLIDTTNDPILSQRRPKGWVSWQRSEDYYNEGLLVWLEVDSILRRESAGRRSLDDFARRFFGAQDGDLGILTYRFEDVVATLNEIQPYGWADLLQSRLHDAGKPAPLEGLVGNGYRLVYTDTPTAAFRHSMAARQTEDLSYSLGLIVGDSGNIPAVIWNGPAFKAGVTVGHRLVSVNGEAYSPSILREAIAAAKGGTKPITLLLRLGNHYQTVEIPYYDGPRYPRLEKTVQGEAGLDRLLAPL